MLPEPLWHVTGRNPLYNTPYSLNICELDVAIVHGRCNNKLIKRWYIERAQQIVKPNKAASPKKDLLVTHDQTCPRVRAVSIIVHFMYI